MKKLLVIFSVFAVLFMVFGTAQSATVTLNITPNLIPDETQPRVNLGDSPAGFGPDSWQGPGSGKTNWHARYLLDGNYLSALFPGEAATLTIGDLASISYYTKRPTGTPAGRDWWIQIYTRPTGTGDKTTWYHDRFINNYNDHTATDVWTQYSTASGMTFQSNGLGGTPYELTLAELALHDTGLIEMISVQTDSAWNGFDGFMDGLEITLENGDVGRVDFSAPVPIPGAVLLLGSGIVGLAGFRKRFRRS